MRFAIQQFVCVRLRVVRKTTEVKDGWCLYNVAELSVSSALR